LVIYACPRCGSRRIRQGALYVGALTGSKEVCRNCGYQGIPLIFDSERDYHAFLQELSSSEQQTDQTPLSEKDKMVLEYAKEKDQFNTNERDVLEKKPLWFNHNCWNYPHLFIYLSFDFALVFVFILFYRCFILISKYLLAYSSILFNYYNYCYTIWLY